MILRTRVFHRSGSIGRKHLRRGHSRAMSPGEPGCSVRCDVDKRTTCGGGAPAISDFGFRISDFLLNQSTDFRPKAHGRLWGRRPACLRKGACAAEVPGSGPSDGPRARHPLGKRAWKRPRAAEVPFSILLGARSSPPAGTFGPTMLKVAPLGKSVGKVRVPQRHTLPRA